MNSSVPAKTTYGHGSNVAQNKTANFIGESLAPMVRSNPGAVHVDVRYEATQRESLQ